MVVRSHHDSSQIASAIFDDEGDLKKWNKAQYEAASRHKIRGLRVQGLPEWAKQEDETDSTTSSPGHRKRKEWSNAGTTKNHQSSTEERNQEKKEDNLQLEVYKGGKEDSSVPQTQQMQQHMTLAAQLQQMALIQQQQQQLFSGGAVPYQQTMPLTVPPFHGNNQSINGFHGNGGTPMYVFMTPQNALQAHLGGYPMQAFASPIPPPMAPSTSPTLNSAYSSRWSSSPASSAQTYDSSQGAGPNQNIRELEIQGNEGSVTNRAKWGEKGVGVGHLWHPEAYDKPETNRSPSQTLNPLHHGSIKKKHSKKQARS